MPKGEKRKEPSQEGLRRTTMGSFFSLSGSKSSKKSDKVSTSKKETKLPPERFGKRRMWGNWAARDTEEYRDRYPGKKEYPNRRDNLLFYTNELRSKPDGDYIDDIHEKWYGDYERLERHHGYIQWLFPIRESGLNWHAQELQLHEIDAILKDAAAKKRVLTSYKMMLDFYGMRLKDEETGEIIRADNWKPRFRHLNRSFHNYLRITRILKCLGEFDYEYLKPPFIKFILEEAFIHGTLDNLLESCERYWIGVLRDEEAREEVWNYYEDLYIKAQQSEEKQEKQEDKYKQSAQGKKDKTTKENVIDVDVEFDSDNETLDTLEYAMDMNNSLEEGGTETKSETNEKTRKAHTISDSDEDSQEARYWENENNKGASSQIVEDASLGSDAIEDEQGLDKDNRDAKGGQETEFDAVIVIDSEDVERKSKSRKTDSGDDIVNEIGKENKSNNTMNLKSSESETVLAGVNELSEHSDTPMNDNENKQTGIATDGAKDQTPESLGRTQVDRMEKSDKKDSNYPSSNSTTESIVNEITDAMKEDNNDIEEDKTNTAGKVICEDNMDMNVEPNIANSAFDIKGNNEGGQEDQMDTDVNEKKEEPMES